MPRASGPLAEALAHRAVLLDGGLSNQLAAQGCDLSGGLWSGRVLAERPDQVEAAHTAYARAGAEVLITASYQVGYEAFAAHGHDRAETTALLHRSVRLAARAAEAADHEVWVAASVGPYGAVLADGSEYRGRYGLGVRELAAFHRPRIEALLAAGPDVLAVETIPDADEAEALLTVLAETGAPAWFSYTVAAGRTQAAVPSRRPSPSPPRPRRSSRSASTAATPPTCCPPSERRPPSPPNRCWPTPTTAPSGTPPPEPGTPRSPCALAPAGLAQRRRPPRRRLLPHRPGTHLRPRSPPAGPAALRAVPRARKSRGTQRG